jgi:acetyltransferase-like isoleucine patch superfamily enzyme
MPGACIGGDVEIEEDVLVGANSTILQGVRVGRGAVVGAGATVVNGVDPGVTVVGTPARKIGHI